MFWSSDAEVYAHGYLGSNQVIIAGQHGLKTVVDLRRRCTSAHMQRHDASRIRHSSQVCATFLLLRCCRDEETKKSPLLALAPTETSLCKWLRTGTCATLVGCASTPQDRSMFLPAPFPFTVIAQFIPNVWVHVGPCISFAGVRFSARETFPFGRMSRRMTEVLPRP